MIQELYQKALKFAGEKHANQKVPGTNANYLLHISNVTMEIIMAHKAEDNFDLEYAIQIGILHDTLEDTDTTFDELTSVFSLEIAQGVSALTKNDALNTKAEKMLDSLDRINQGRMEVGIVKLADRITNLQKPPVTWSSEKINDYLEESKTIAHALENKNRYLNNRLAGKIKDYEQYLADSLTKR